MVRVLIVGKTKKWDKTCVGGITIDNAQSIRLLTSNGDDHPKNTPYNLGDMWDMQLKAPRRNQIKKPHTENTLVLQDDHMETYSLSAVRKYVTEAIGAPLIEPKHLFDGLLRFTDNRKWYVSPSDGLPSYSTGFWRLQKALRLFWVTQNKERKSRYIYVDNEGGNPTFDVPYVGYQEPLEVIPSHTVLRFSLAQPFSNDKQKRCYLQLSGWFI